MCALVNVLFRPDNLTQYRVLQLEPNRSSSSDNNNDDKQIYKAP